MADSAHSWKRRQPVGDWNRPSAASVFVRDTQLAERYGVTRQTIWRWVREERFPPPVRLAPGTVRWRLGDVEAWESAREVA